MYSTVLGLILSAVTVVLRYLNVWVVAPALREVCLAVRCSEGRAHLVGTSIILYFEAHIDLDETSHSRRHHLQVSVVEGAAIQLVLLWWGSVI